MKYRIRTAIAYHKNGLYHRNVKDEILEESDLPEWAIERGCAVPIKEAPKKRKPARQSTPPPPTTDSEAS